MHVSIWGGVRSSLVLWKESFRKSSFFVLLSSCCGQVRSSSFRVRVPCPGSQKSSSSSVRPSELPGCGGWDVGEKKRKYGGASPEGVTRSGPPAFPNRLPPFPNRVPSTVGKYSKESEKNQDSGARSASSFLAVAQFLFPVASHPGDNPSSSFLAVASGHGQLSFPVASSPSPRSELPNA